MKLVMVTTSHAHWDGLAGNTAMFSEAVVQPAILDSLPTIPVDTVFIKKDPQTRKFERAWRGKAKNFKRISKQDKEYVSFDIEGLKKINCPEILRTKTVGCHILTEQPEQNHVAPKRPLGRLPQLKENAESKKSEEHKPLAAAEKFDPETILHPNGQEDIYSRPEETNAIVDVVFTPEFVPEPSENGRYSTSENGARKTPEADDLAPGFFNSLMQTNDPVLFEKYCFLLLRLLGVHDIHRPANHAGADAHGFFKFRTLSVVYTTTLVPAVLQENKMITEHYLNLLKKEKINFATTSYTLKDTQKQVWVICRSNNEQLLMKTEDDIKLKLIPVQQLLALYQLRLSEEQISGDGLWSKMMNI